jgi:hypothetical protein
VAASFLFIGFARAGVRMGRKTYLIDYAPEQQRPLYVALSNTFIGLLALAGGTLGLVAQTLGVNAVIALLIVAALIGAIVSRGLPDVRRGEK